MQARKPRLKPESFDIAMLQQYIIDFRNAVELLNLTEKEPYRSVYLILKKFKARPVDEINFHASIISEIYKAALDRVPDMLEILGQYDELLSRPILALSDFEAKHKADDTSHDLDRLEIAYFSCQPDQGNYKKYAERAYDLVHRKDIPMFPFPKCLALAAKKDAEATKIVLSSRRLHSCLSDQEKLELYLDHGHSLRSYAKIDKGATLPKVVAGKEWLLTASQTLMEIFVQHGGNLDLVRRAMQERKAAKERKAGVAKALEAQADRIQMTRFAREVALGRGLAEDEVTDEADKGKIQHINAVFMKHVGEQLCDPFTLNFIGGLAIRWGLKEDQQWYSYETLKSIGHDIAGRPVSASTRELYEKAQKDTLEYRRLCIPGLRNFAKEIAAVEEKLTGEAAIRREKEIFESCMKKYGWPKELWEDTRPESSPLLPPARPASPKGRDR